MKRVSSNFFKILYSTHLQQILPTIFEYYTSVYMLHKSSLTNMNRFIFKEAERDFHKL